MSPWNALLRTDQGRYQSLAMGTRYLIWRPERASLPKLPRPLRWIITPDREPIELLGPASELLHLPLHPMGRPAQAPPVLRVEHRPAVRDWVFVIRQLREGQLAVLVTPHRTDAGSGAPLRPSARRDRNPDPSPRYARSASTESWSASERGRAGAGAFNDRSANFFPIASREMASHSVAAPLLAILNRGPLSLSALG
jgi:hypothetical protein